MGDMVFKMKYPDMRDELIDYLVSLSDKDYQDAVWVRREARSGVVHDELDYAIHFIYDDTCLGQNPSEAIGWFLKNEDEAESIRSLVLALNLVFSKYGLDLSDREYIAKPEWSDVVRAAERSRSVLSQPD